MCPWIQERLKRAPMQREFDGNNDDNHLGFPRVKSSAGERRICKNLDRNTKDETSENKKYSCQKIRISEAIENYKDDAFNYLFYLHPL